MIIYLEPILIQEGQKPDESEKTSNSAGWDITKGCCIVYHLIFDKKRWYGLIQINFIQNINAKAAFVYSDWDQPEVKYLMV